MEKEEKDNIAVGLKVPHTPVHSICLSGPSLGFYIEEKKF